MWVELNEDGTVWRGTTEKEYPDAIEVEAPSGVPAYRLWVKDGVARELPSERPTPAHVWDRVSGDWRDPRSAADQRQAKRGQMDAHPLYFYRALRQFTNPAGQTWEELLGLQLAALPETLRRDWANIVLFQRWRPEIAAALQSGGEVLSLTDVQVDDVFELAEQLWREEAAGASRPSPALGP